MDLQEAFPSHERRDRALLTAAATLFVLVATLAGVDLIADLLAGTTVIHVAIEAAVVALGLAGAVWMGSRVRAIAAAQRELRQHAATLTAHLDTSRADAARWRSKASDLIEGLATAIDRQLDAWGLTAAEKDIALLLLKGLSHKQVASLREVSETTVRQQARAIYRKAGLSGRSDLAAFFLEDLLGPRGRAAQRWTP
jgi:DNA-binding NarL/FixJ family response regulator